MLNHTVPYILKFLKLSTAQDPEEISRQSEGSNTLETA